MIRKHIRGAVGTKFVHDGEIFEVIEMVGAAYGVEVVVASGDHVRRMLLKELLGDTRVRFLPSESPPGDDDDDERETAAVILAQLDQAQLHQLRQRVEHVREVLTGYRSGSAEMRREDEPRPEFDPTLPLEQRYAAKARELGISVRTIKRWAGEYFRYGEAGLASKRFRQQPQLDERWILEALEVMVAYTDLSRPTRSAVIRKANLRCEERYGTGVVTAPSRPSAYRALALLEKRHPLFRLSTKRNRDIAGRPLHPYGTLRAARPGEYVYMDTTRLDVFALDPVTLRWLPVELTVALDAYTRCIVGLKLTAVSTKAVDAASVLYQCYRPRPAGRHWPAHAVWPEHGVPRCVLIDQDAIEGPTRAASGPAIVPETIVVDHGKIFVSEHLTSVCAQMGISIQPARIREPRDKAPVERFFRTVREDLLQHLDGYKGPDLNSRGLDVEARAFYYIDELEDVIREWVAAVYHHRRHRGLVEPGLPSARMSPAMMYEHGLARSGYIEVPRDPYLAYEFLLVEARKIQHYGVEIDGRHYSGAILNELAGQASPYTGRFRDRWPIYIDPDDIRYGYMRHPKERTWHTLVWKHAAGLSAPLSDEALRFARSLAARRHRFVDDRLALEELLKRWQVGSGSSAAERRIALNLAREDGRLSQEAKPDDAELVAQLASAQPPPQRPEPDVEVGDDDSDDELDDDYDDGPDEDYYKNALEEA
jgi:transposase InsO family protein